MIPFEKATTDASTTCWVANEHAIAFFDVVLLNIMMASSPIIVVSTLVLAHATLECQK
jgi:hypothetical protein